MKCTQIKILVFKTLTNVKRRARVVLLSFQTLYNLMWLLVIERTSLGSVSLSSFYRNNYAAASVL